MIQTAVRYAFDSTGATAVQLMVFYANTPARHCYDSAGFKERHTQTGAL